MLNRTKSVSRGRPSGKKNYHWNAPMEAKLVSMVEAKGLGSAKQHFWTTLRIHPKAVERKYRKLSPAPRKGESWPAWSEVECTLLKTLAAGTGKVEFISQRISNVNGHLPERGPTAVRSMLIRLGDDLPGSKVGDVCALLGATPRQVKRWVENNYLDSKSGRITEASISRFIKDRPELIPFDSLAADVQRDLIDYGYPVGKEVAPNNRRTQAGNIRKRDLSPDGLTRKQVATAFGVSVRQLRRWSSQGKLRTGTAFTAEELRAFVQSHPQLVKEESLQPDVRAWLSSGAVQAIVTEVQR